MTTFCALASCYCLLPLSYDHINTPRKHPLIIPFGLQMVEVSYDRGMKTGGGITPPPPGGLDKSLYKGLQTMAYTYKRVVTQVTTDSCSNS